jgi:hypothetical protein
MFWEYQLAPMERMKLPSSLFSDWRFRLSIGLLQMFGALVGVALLVITGLTSATVIVAALTSLLTIVSCLTRVD